MTIQVIFNRDSVCAGDDGTSHEERFAVAGSTSLGELLEKEAVPYLIHWPGTTWVLPRVDTYVPEDGPVAELGEPWPSVRFNHAADKDLTVDQLAATDGTEEAGSATKTLTLCFGYDTSALRAAAAAQAQTTAATHAAVRTTATATKPRRRTSAPTPWAKWRMWRGLLAAGLLIRGCLTAWHSATAR